MAGLLERAEWWSQDSWVPAAEPSLFQRSRTLSGPSTAWKNTEPPTFVSRTGPNVGPYPLSAPTNRADVLDHDGPGRGSIATPQFAAVDAILAVKNAVPVVSVSDYGLLDPRPGLMSSTMAVPFAVPSLLQSSFPWIHHRP